MLIRPFDDLHIEFSKNKFTIEPLPTDLETTLVLAGDIGVGDKACSLIREWAEQFKYVIYVAGNHEFYGHVWQDVVADIRSEFADIQNAFFLEKESVTLDGVSFFGATFWTDANVPEYDKYVISKQMNDFKLIKRTHDLTGKAVRITPDTYRYWFLDTIVKYREWINNGFEGKRVVVSHHAPSSKSSLKCFAGSPMNAFYYFESLKWCDNLKLVDLWFHGHMHNTSDYIMASGTRVIANPFGYDSYDENPGFNPTLVINTDD